MAADSALKEWAPCSLDAKEVQVLTSRGFETCGPSTCEQRRIALVFAEKPGQVIKHGHAVLKLDLVDEYAETPLL
jgi:hypothetical protein